MSHSDFFSTLRSSDHDFIAALRFLGEYAGHVYERGHHHQSYRHFVPRFDLEQHEDTYELYGELPGFRREDILIEAHDDHLQVSGSISRLTSEPAAAASESKKSENVNNSTIEPKDQKALKEAPNGEEPKPTQKSTSSAKVPPPTSDAIERTTTAQERYLNARFGDVLDPHAKFVREKDEPEATDTMPEVRCLISERRPSAFHRAFHFPTPIKKDEVAATMQDGILHISAKRAPMPPPVKVKVRDDLEALSYPDYPLVMS
jgi:HSP20 family molecular chaperone IbpA